MRHNRAIAALEKERAIVIGQRNEAMRIAAAPFNKDLEQIDYSLQQLKDLDKDIEEPEVTIKEIKRRGRKKVDIATIQNFDMYPFEGTIIERFLYVLKEAKKVLSMAQIAHKVFQYEGNTPLDIVKERFGKHTAKYQTYGYIKVIGKNKRNIFYGLPEWFDKSGILLPEYETNDMRRLREMEVQNNSMLLLLNSANPINS